MRAPSAIVAEDEAALREQLVEQLHALWPELLIAGVAVPSLILRLTPRPLAWGGLAVAAFFRGFVISAPYSGVPKPPG